jgi:signal transduction histidine kinase
MWIGSSTDIDEQKRLEERKNTFISMASHELKTPITSLRGFTQVLQRRLKQQADPQTLLFLDRMDAQLGKLTTLIGDLLDVSRMEAGTIAYRETRFDLDGLARETVEDVQAAITTHRLSLEGETHAQVRGDRDRLGQALINLLTNAVKYSPQADSVTVRLSADQGWAEVAVCDHGIGIAAEYHERVFEQFYQVADPQESTYPGLGIGLYIARTLIERHGGRMWLESQKGAGSVFHFTLPTLAEQSVYLAEPDAANASDNIEATK